MTHKLLVSVATTFTLALGTASAFADVPMPECVNNPACNQGGGCSGSALPSGTPAGAGIAALLAATALLAGRRRAR